jgi:hypothetical protein
MARPAQRQPERRPVTLQRWLVALAAVGAWSILPPYLGPAVGLELDVDPSLEVIDHVLPGLLAIAGALFALSLARRGAPDSVPALAALAVCALAGLFQTVTHVPLVLDAGGPTQPVGAVVLHSTPGPVLTLLALALLLRPLPDDGR